MMIRSSLLRPVAPEHAESGRRAVLNACLEDLFAFLVGIFERLYS